MSKFCMALDLQETITDKNRERKLTYIQPESALPMYADDHFIIHNLEMDLVYKLQNYILFKIINDARR